MCAPVCATVRVHVRVRVHLRVRARSKQNVSQTKILVGKKFAVWKFKNFVEFFFFRFGLSLHHFFFFKSVTPKSLKVMQKHLEN